MTTVDAVYQLTGVTKSSADPVALVKLSDTFATVAACASAVSQGTTAVVTSIESANRGAATDAYKTSMAETIKHLVYLEATANSTHTAHATAAATVTAFQQKADGVCLSAAATLTRLLLNPLPGPLNAYYWNLTVDTAKTQLTELFNAGADAVTTCYAGITPIQRLTLSEGESRGTVPKEVEDAYGQLSPEKRMQFLKNLADQVMKDWPPDKKAKVIFYSHAEPLPPGCVRPPNGANWSGYNGVSMGDSIYLNYDIACARPDGTTPKPTLMSTTVHELQHQKQNHMREQYNALSEADKEAIRKGQKADPFVQYGSTIHEAGTRFGTPYQSADKPGYTHQHVEIDARRAGTEYLDNMSAQEMKDLMP